jgi:hypothetical protein
MHFHEMKNNVLLEGGKGSHKSSDLPSVPYPYSPPHLSSFLSSTEAFLPVKPSTNPKFKRLIGQ